ncbi:MAG: TIGR01212 family radical SAM protein [Candidatus Omnitrophica bacterium]|nr:TIGR01212 family radical SAM protein [Candidatus Omnitrophota bacterium]
MKYYSFSSYLKRKFDQKVWRICLDPGFGCPNKEGHTGRGGCIYCNESGFSDIAGKRLPLKDQIEDQISRARKKRGIEKFIAYFQSGTGTNARVENLKASYDVIRDYPEIVGLAVSTRPDCIDDEKLDLIAGYTRDYDVWIEYGVQSVHDNTLERIGRGHGYDQSKEAIRRTCERGIKSAAHVILGLPGETHHEMVATSTELSRLPLWGVKLHVLHVLKDTPLEEDYNKGKLRLLDRGEYVSIACDFIENLRKDCVILRILSDARKEFLVAPRWINAKQAVLADIEDEFTKRGTGQGSSNPS